MIDRDTNDWYDISEPYVCGKCMYLACALRERFDWRICAYIEEDHVSRYISHAWVVDEKGRPYDVDGFRDDGIMDIYGGVLEENLTIEKVFVLNSENGESQESFKQGIAEAHAFIDRYLLSELPGTREIKTDADENLDNRYTRGSFDMGG